jgi:CubicO group peptidase (beta-lactamase class C family)
LRRAARELRALGRAALAGAALARAAFAGVILTGASLGCFAAPAATPDLGALDEYVSAEMRSQSIPGLSLAVLHAGKPVYVKSFGVATLELAVPTRPDTRFQIGSIGKQFTATLVMLLARDHRLELDDPLSKYLPEIPASWREVTLRQMLKHQSGIAQLTPPDRDLLDLHHDYTDQEYVHLASSVPLDFEPGTDASYSDTAYVLLGIVIGRVTGRFYGDLLEERVFHPLDMARTRIISDTDIIPGRAAGYVRGASGALENQGWVAPALNRTADGSLYSTVLDLAHWDAALTEGAILSAAELERMWRIDALKNGEAPLLHYGYGWEINTLRGHRVIEYDGNWQGFQAAMARYQDRHLTVIVLTNLALCRVQRIAHTVAGYFDPEVAHFKAATADPRPNWTRAFASFATAIGQPSAAPAAGERSLARVMPSTWLHALARDLEETGPISGVAFAEERQVAGGVERTYRVETRDMVDFFTVRYRADGAPSSIALYHEY